MARFAPKVFGEQHGTPTEQEQRVAVKLGGRRQAGSGASDYAKGDVKAGDFLIECKQTEKQSLSVKGEWLSKITREAMAAGRTPALSIEIKGIDDRLVEHDWVAVPMSVFRRLTGQSD
jgi:Holliday junction resolvase